MRGTQRGDTVFMTESEQLLSVEDVARRLGLNPETIRRYLRQGAIKGVRFGFRAGWRIKEADLAAFLEQKTRDTQPRGG